MAQFFMVCLVRSSIARKKNITRRQYRLESLELPDIVNKSPESGRIPRDPGGSGRPLRRLPDRGHPD